MEIIDIKPDHAGSYFKCLEDWSEEMKEAGDHKSRWYDKYRERGLRIKLALNDNGQPGGMIQYLPVEESFIQGNGLYFILCIWVHGHRQGIGNLQKKGMGKALLRAAEEDIKSLDADGMAAWGLWLPFWMKASWFKHHGYKKADRDGISMLVWKAFSENARPPRWIRQQKRVPAIPGKVSVTGFLNGWCPAQNLVYERAKRASAEFGDAVVFQTIDTSDRDTYLEWGISDGIYIDGKKVGSGPPASYEKIRGIIAKRLKKTN